MVFCQGAHVQKMYAPFRLDVRLATICIIRICVHVATQPHVNSARMRREVVLEGLCVWFAVNPVKIRSALRSSLFKVAMIMSNPVSIFIPSHPFPLAGCDGRIFQDIVMHADDDRLRIGLYHSLPPGECLSTHDATRIAA